MKELKKFLHGKRVRNAFSPADKNGVKRFQPRAHARFCAEKVAIAAKLGL
jgi:hypothetical protein